MAEAEFLEQLGDGLQALGVTAGESQLRRLQALCDLVRKWNGAYKLTAITEASQMLTKHLLDSAAVLQYVRGPLCLDVGTGAGFPGLVLAILEPDLQLVCLDSNGKKIRFVRQACLELKLVNAAGVQMRLTPSTTPAELRARLDAEHAAFELSAPGCEFDTIVSRATMPAERLLKSCLRLSGARTRFLVMEGHPQPMDWAAGFSVTRQSLSIPGLDARRHAVILERAGSTLGISTT